MMYPLVRDLAGDGIPVAVTCRVLGFSKQAFYKWQKSPVSDRDWSDAHLIDRAIHIHRDDPEFGYRFIADELNRTGTRCGENRVARLCSLQGIWSVHARRRGRGRRPGPPVHGDLVRRDFWAGSLNELWYADLTEHPTSEGKLYLCAIKDACSNRIVGYSMDERMTSALAVRALRNAIALRSPAATIVHTDRGSQFRSGAFLTVLTRNGLAGSMGRVAACADNAAMESFFSLLQRTSLTASGGQPANNAASRSRGGPGGPTTAAVVNEPSAGSHQSNMKHSPETTNTAT